MKKPLIAFALLVLVGAGCAQTASIPEDSGTSVELGMPVPNLPTPEMEVTDSAAGGTQPAGTPTVNDTPDARIDLGTSTAPAQGIAVGEPNPSAPVPGPTRSTVGQIIAIDLDGIAYDAPALLTVLQKGGAKQDIRVPSFGLGLCAAKDAIADLQDLKLGDMIAVRGELSDDGSIIPCRSADHYLRLETK